MKVAILDDYLNVALDLGDWAALEGRAQLSVFDTPFSGEDDAAAKLADYEIIVGMRERTPFPASLINRLPALKLLITTGMRNQSFDMEAAKAQGVTVCGAGGLGQPTAELTWAMILGLACHIPTHDNTMKDGGWQTKLNGMLQGKTLGVLGLGKLGGAVANVGKAFGMRVIAWSQNLKDERAAEIGAERVSKDELLAQSDYISIHLVLSDRSARTDRPGRSCPDEANRLSGEYFARPDRRPGGADRRLARRPNCRCRYRCLRGRAAPCGPSASVA